MVKLIEVAKALLEGMTSNNYHWSNKRATSKKSEGKYEVDAMTLIASRVNELAQVLDKVGVSPTLHDSSSFFS